MRGAVTEPGREQARLQRRKIRTLDLFAGLGGSSQGARDAGVRVVAAVDSWSLAAEAYGDNFPKVKFYQMKSEDLSPRRIKREAGPIHLLLASPECTSHTMAKGKRRRSEQSRETALQVIRFAKVLRPRWIVVENVLQMKRWRRYKTWIRSLIELGYSIHEHVLDASKYGVPQSRRRLFVLCDLETDPPKKLASSVRNRRPAAQIIRKGSRYRFTLLKSKGRSRATLKRAKRAIAKLGNRREFLLVYYSSDAAGGWQRLQVPLRTVTTIDRFAYVRPNGRYGHEMRMLQVPELKTAMGFPPSFRIDMGTRREQVRLLGNAVCPPVMKAAINGLIGKHREPSR